jgi:hypothetical protein
VEYRILAQDRDGLSWPDGVEPLAHSAFFGVGSIVAMDLVTPERRRHFAE